MQTVHKALEKNSKVAPFLIKGQPIIISSVSTSLSESVRSLVTHAAGKQMDGSVGQSVLWSVCQPFHQPTYFLPFKSEQEATCATVIATTCYKF